MNERALRTTRSCTASSNFSFLRGASHAEELIAQAKELGYTALAITDECSLAGVVRAHTAPPRKIGGIKLLIGAEFALDCGLRLVIIARNRAGYGAPVAAHHARPPQARRRAATGSTRADVEEFLGRWRDAARPKSVGAGTLALWLPPLGTDIGRAGRVDRAHASRAAPGSRWSWCATAATASAWRRARALGAAIRPAADAPPATCTCICASAAGCRMRSRPCATG